MMRTPLNLSVLFERGVRLQPDEKIVTKVVRTPNRWTGCSGCNVVLGSNNTALVTGGEIGLGYGGE